MNKKHKFFDTFSYFYMQNAVIFLRANCAVIFDSSQVGVKSKIWSQLLFYRIPHLILVQTLWQLFSIINFTQGTFSWFWQLVQNNPFLLQNNGVLIFFSLMNKNKIYDLKTFLSWVTKKISNIYKHHLKNFKANNTFIIYLFKTVAE